MRRTAKPQQSLIEIWSEKKSEFEVMRTMQRGSRGVTGLLHRKRPRRPRASRGRAGVDLDSSSFEVVGTRDMVEAPPQAQGRLQLRDSTYTTYTFTKV